MVLFNFHLIQSLYNFKERKKKKKYIWDEILFPALSYTVFHLFQFWAEGYLNFVMSFFLYLTDCLSAMLSPATLICISNHFVLTNSRRFSFETMNPTATRTTRVIVLSSDNKSQETQTKSVWERQREREGGELDWTLKESVGKKLGNCKAEKNLA